MILYPHQAKEAPLILQTLRQYAMAYIAWEERTGKTLAALHTVELSRANAPLIITKKAALPGWEKTLAQYDHDLIPTLTTYTSIHNLRLRPYDIVILDESHAYISAFPKRSATYHLIQELTRGYPILYLSATPHAQSLSQLYHQLALSTWSPFPHKDFISWHAEFGEPYKQYLGTHKIDMYDALLDDKDMLKRVSHLFHTKTRQELGFKQEPTDQLHYITLDKPTAYVYNVITKHKVYLFRSGDRLIADSVSKVRTSLHQLEGGTIKITPQTTLILQNREKIAYILDHWGDSPDLVIMYNFKAELLKLQAVFFKAQILQATSYAEGVDLSHITTLVIYSQDYSTTRHIQRRARQANKNRILPINVHFLLVRNAISQHVYETVAINKVNYTDSLYRPNLIE